MLSYGVHEYRQSKRKHNPAHYSERPLEQLLRGLLKNQRAARRVAQWLEEHPDALLSADLSEIEGAPDVGEATMHALACLKELQIRTINQHLEQPPEELLNAA